MTLPLPTAISFKMRFQKLANANDADIEFALEEGALMFASGDWVNDANKAWAILLYAAHIIEMSNLRLTSGQSIISSERTPDLSVTYAVPDQNKPLDFTMTEYGERLMRLVKKNFPAIMVVNSATRM